jgi:hypothetical protein
VSGTTKSSGNGLGFGTVLFLIFLVLKLTGFIAWSWWWIFAPVWIPVAVIVLVAIFAAAVAASGGGRR